MVDAREGVENRAYFKAEVDSACEEEGQKHWESRFCGELRCSGILMVSLGDAGGEGDAHLLYELSSTI